MTENKEFVDVVDVNVVLGAERIPARLDLDHVTNVELPQDPPLSRRYSAQHFRQFLLGRGRDGS